MTIRLPQEVERRLASEASRLGLLDPDELARRQAEGEAFMQGLARNRPESEGPAARKRRP